MRWLVIPVLALSAITARAQMQVDESPDPAALPDAPSAMAEQQRDVVVVSQAARRNDGANAVDCNATRAMRIIYVDPNRVDEVRRPCSDLIYPYQRFLSTNVAIPLTWQKKGYLALHDLVDPANAGTILGISAITIGSDAHTAYGPGWKGFGKIVGVSVLQDATGEFFGTFLIPTVAHQDPRYFRMAHESVPKRILYSVSRTIISRHDDGSSMPNYSTLLTYPISAELSNLYVPGIHSDASSTVTRIFTGLATDPANNLLNEFLPDVAKRVHVRIIFVQSILNNVANGGTLP
ncbi:MAG TPA: hypothetical protein VK627_03495 [Edaphobacter sp.]|nr:hypothetical protein [Edaphobacter sp.]